MATRAKTTSAEPEVVGSILLLPVAEIDVGKRLRALDRVWAAALGQVMAKDGQRTPIEVCRLPGKTGWTLVAGAHRLVGARFVGMAYVRAIVVEADARERTIRNDLMLHRRLSPALVAMLRDYESDEGVPGHPVLRNAGQLRQLAKLDEVEQHQAVVALVEGTATTVAEASGAKRANRVPQPEDKHLSAFLGAWQRMSLAQKKGAIAHLSKMLPAGYRFEDTPPRTSKGFPAAHEQYREEALTNLDTAIGLLDGLIEDEIVADERLGAMESATLGLRYTRMTICGDGFELHAPAGDA